MPQEQRKDFNFMGYRRYFIGLSVLLAIGSIVAFINPGPRFGTDFVGGTEVTVAFKSDVDAGQIRSAINDLGFASPDVVKLASEVIPHQYLIRVKEVSSISDEQRAALEKKLCLVKDPTAADAGAELDQAACPPELRTREVKFSPGGDKVSVRYVKRTAGETVSICDAPKPNEQCPLKEIYQNQLGTGVAGVELRSGLENPVVTSPRENQIEFLFKGKGEQIMDGLRAKLGAEVVPERPLKVQWIGAKAGKDLRDAAIKSLTIAIVFIMVFIAFRFDMRFAPGAILALLHDVFLAVGAMVLFQREVTLSTVAALLTIVGYSINDTVVVYDRIRENLGKYRKMTFPAIINRSLTEMLGRTIRTSTLTAAAMFPFLFFGTGVIRDFAFTLLVGVVVGTYSSIYVAAPLTELIDRKLFGQTVKKKRRVKRRKRPAAPAPAS